MLAEGHRKAAEGIENGMAQVQNLDAGAARVVIEAAWGAGFHWIAYGCETKYHKHQNNHTRLGRFLRDLGEATVAKLWEDLDNARQGGWYGGEPDPEDAQGPLALLAQIRQWAVG